MAMKLAPKARKQLQKDMDAQLNLPALEAGAELLRQTTKEPSPLQKAIEKEEPQRNGTPAAQVIKGLIQKRLDSMTFLELALTLAHVMEKKG